MTKILLILSILVGSAFAGEINFIGSSASVYEESGTYRIYITLSEASSKIVTAHYSTSGSATYPDDHNLDDGTIVFYPGVTETSILLKVKDDGIYDAPENLFIELQSAMNATIGEFKKYSIDLYDESPFIVPIATLVNSHLITREGDIAKIEVQLSEPTFAIVNIPYEISGVAQFPEDHNVLNGVLTIEAGEVSSTLSVNIANDGIYELNNEEFTISLKNPVSNAILGINATQSIHILGENPSPLMVGDQTLLLKEDSPLIFSLLGATDDGGEVITYNAVSSVQNGVLSGCVDGTTSKNCTFTPNQDFSGVVSFSYSANDGNQNSILNSKVTLIVEGVNDRPISPSDYSLNTLKNTTLNFSLSPGVDVDQDQLTYTIISHPASGIISGCGDGSLSTTCIYTPALDFEGVVTLRYIVNDGRSNSSNSTTVTINVSNSFQRFINKWINLF